MQSEEGSASLTVVPDGYFDKLAKLIPAESFAAYAAIDGMIRATKGVNLVVDWVVFAILVVGTPLYLRKSDKHIGFPQLIVSTAAFVAFALANGGVFERTIENYSSVYGAIFVIVIVFCAPLLDDRTWD